MREKITAIYEKGVLRPLVPLSLPEHTRVHIQIVKASATSTKEEARRHVRQVLLDAGVIQPHPPIEATSVSEQQLARAAEALAVAGSVSDLIIADRDER